jgi:uncharacterized membrane protein
MNLAIRVYGLSGIALGTLGLIWGDFAGIWQPVPTETPGRTGLAYAAAVLSLAGGAALQWRRSVPVGAALLALLHLAFTALWARRIIGFPEMIGTWSGTAEPLAMALGAVASYAAIHPERPASARLAQSARILFGLCLIAFGLAHFLAAAETAVLVPGWIPPNQHFWAFATGLFHLLAGGALVSNIRAVLAARLLTIMFVGFGLLVWAPQLFLYPKIHMVWAGNAINFAMIAAAWAMAHCIALFSGRETGPGAAGASLASEVRGGTMGMHEG